MKTQSDPVETKVKIIRRALGRITRQKPSHIATNRPLRELFLSPSFVRALWETLPELWEHRIPVNSSWSVFALAVEWEKTLHVHQ